MIYSSNAENSKLFEVVDPNHCLIIETSHGEYVGINILMFIHANLESKKEHDSLIPITMRHGRNPPTDWTSFHLKLIHSHLLLHKTTN